MSIAVGRQGFGDLNLVRGRDIHEYERVIASMAGVVKQTTGTTNFIAYYTMLDAMDQLKKHPQFRQDVKKAYRKAMDMYFDYEKNLRYSKAPRFFCVKDMPPEARAKYKPGFTDAEYWEMWCDVGASSHASYHKQLKVLYWKYVKSLNGHGVRYSEILGYVLIADMALQMSSMFYRSLVDEIGAASGVGKSAIDRLFRPFSLEDVRDAWGEACIMMSRVTGTEFNVGADDEHNISLGVRQLEEAITKDIVQYDGLREAVELNRDKFATKYDYRAAINEINRLAEI